MQSTTASDNCANTCIKKDVKAVENPINKHDVEVIVKRVFGSATKLIDFHIEFYSKGTVGYMGVHRSLVVKFQRIGHSDEESISFFVKWMPYGVDEQMAIIEDGKMFIKETNFYKHIAPELMANTTDKSWLAQCYLVKDSVLVFEDLKLKNFHLKSKLLDMASLKSACAAIAKLHAASILAEKRLGKTFYERYPELLSETVFVTKGRFSNWISSGTDVLIAVAKSLGLNSACVPRVLNRIFEVLTASKKWRNVLNHGDPWSFNIMFDDATPLPKCVLLDFQGIRYVPASSDLLQLIYLSTTREFRNKNEQNLLRYYHEVLCATLSERDKNINLPTIKEILQEYEDLRVIGVVTAALYYPIMCIDGLRSAEMVKDSDGFAKVFFNKRDNLVLNMMQEDPLYKERVTEITEELVERSNQLLS